MKTMLRSAAWLAVLAATVPLPAQAQEPQGYTAPFAESLEARVFPLFAFLHHAEGWPAALRDSAPLQRVMRDRATRVPAETCPVQPQCLTDAWIWTDADIATVDAELRRLAARPDLARALVQRHMRASGRFARHDGLDDAGMVSAAWQEAAKGINRTIAVYGLGQEPLYPKIDAIIFDVTHQEYPALLQRHGVATAALGRDDDLFFDPALRYATGLLMMNERVQAATFRPLLSGENAAPVAAVQGTDWSQYRYPALLVFGHGPEDPQSGTGPMAHIRLRLAADMYARGLAPFIVVSGGNVHPNRTRSNEAMEMKRLLSTLHGVPADRILIEPHARHTTTNLRNAARLMLAAGIPADRPSLIVSDHITIQYIAGPVLYERNLREMGVQPGVVKPGPDKFTALFTPDADAFHVEVSDPLDP